MKAVLLAFMLFALPALASATYLQVVGPVNANLTNNQSVFLGKVGPGQSFYISASAATVNASGFPINIGWDKLVAVSLPKGWSAQPSPLYENPMVMKITVSPNATGYYNLTLRAVNVGNYSRLGNLTFYAGVNVNLNVFNLNVTPVSLTSGIGQPVNLYITINNTGISDDPFVINANLPAWNQPYSVISLHGTKNTYTYPIYLEEPGPYHFNLTVTSSTSSYVTKYYRINLLAQSSLLNDYSAVGQGVPVTPIIYEPVYAVMYLVDKVFQAIFH